MSWPRKNLEKNGKSMWSAVHMKKGLRELNTEHHHWSIARLLFYITRTDFIKILFNITFHLHFSFQVWLSEKFLSFHISFKLHLHHVYSSCCVIWLVILHEYICTFVALVTLFKYSNNIRRCKVSQYVI